MHYKIKCDAFQSKNESFWYIVAFWVSDICIKSAFCLVNMADTRNLQGITYISTAQNNEDEISLSLQYSLEKKKGGAFCLVFD